MQAQQPSAADARTAPTGRPGGPPCGPRLSPDRECLPHLPQERPTLSWCGWTPRLTVSVAFTRCQWHRYSGPVACDRPLWPPPRRSASGHRRCRLRGARFASRNGLCLSCLSAGGLRRRTAPSARSGCSPLRRRCPLANRSGGGGKPPPRRPGFWGRTTACRRPDACGSPSLRPAGLGGRRGLRGGGETGLMPFALSQPRHTTKPPDGVCGCCLAGSHSYHATVELSDADSIN